MMKKSKNKRFFNKLISVPNIWIVLICIWLLVFKPYGYSLNNKELYQLLLITFTPIIAWFIIYAAYRKFNFKKLLATNAQEGFLINSIKEFVLPNISRIIVLLLLLLALFNSYQIRELERYISYDISSIEDRTYAMSSSIHKNKNNISDNERGISDNNDNISYVKGRVSDNEDNLSTINNYYLHKH